MKWKDDIQDADVVEVMEESLSMAKIVRKRLTEARCEVKYEKRIVQQLRDSLNASGIRKRMKLAQGQVQRLLGALYSIATVPEQGIGITEVRKVALDIYDNELAQKLREEAEIAVDAPLHNLSNLTVDCLIARLDEQHGIRPCSDVTRILRREVAGRKSEACEAVALHANHLTRILQERDLMGMVD